MCIIVYFMCHSRLFRPLCVAYDTHEIPIYNGEHAMLTNVRLCSLAPLSPLQLRNSSHSFIFLSCSFLVLVLAESSRIFECRLSYFLASQEHTHTRAHAERNSVVCFTSNIGLTLSSLVPLFFTCNNRLVWLSAYSWQLICLYDFHVETFASHNNDWCFIFKREHVILHLIQVDILFFIFFVCPWLFGPPQLVGLLLLLLLLLFL